MDDNQKRYLTVKEVSEMMRLSDRTVRLLLAQGDIPGAKIGDVWRVDREQLERKFQQVK